MTKKKIFPRVLLAGMNSGCGKTSITCGVLKALRDREIEIQSYKCGPDYIDPMLHSHITGRACRNLDPFFSTEDELRQLMAKDSGPADFSVVEGVMGYYDGIGVSCEKSTHTVSAATETPTILIVNAKGMSHTMIPLIKGMLTYRDNPVCGVILNRCSKGLYLMIKPEIERTLPVRVVGYFPNDDGVHIGSRHLGLMTAAEIRNLDEVIDRLGALAAECIDLDLLLELGRRAGQLPEMPRAGKITAGELSEATPRAEQSMLPDTAGVTSAGELPEAAPCAGQTEPLDTAGETQAGELPEAKPCAGRTEPPDTAGETQAGMLSGAAPQIAAPVRIAVAWDKAFCFYYQENLDLLRQAGAELVFFSPVEDADLPENTGGVYLGGGYPETYRRELSENLSMKTAICRAAENGMPVLAECGGFMYTCENLIETDGSALPMLGLIPTDVEMTKRLSMDFGYVTMEALCDTPFFAEGDRLRVHEFHYSKAAQRGDICRMTKTTGRSWTGMYVRKNVLAGYPHLYFHNCPQVPERFVRLAEEYRRR